MTAAKPTTHPPTAKVYGRAALLVLGVFLLLVAFAVSTALYRAHPDDFYAHALRRLFDVDDEANVPAWFSTLLWLLAARLAWKVGDVETLTGAPLAGRTYWRLLACVAVFLSLDEAAVWHETVGLAISQWVHGFPGYAWTLYGLVFALAVASLFGPLLLKLDRKSALLLVGAGALFVAGSAILENVGPNFRMRRLYFPWATEQAIEESCEMLGVILLIFALERRRLLCAEARGAPKG